MSNKKKKVFRCVQFYGNYISSDSILQKDRAENLIYEYVLKNGHDVEKILINRFANIAVWKVIYSTSDSIMLMQ